VKFLKKIQLFILDLLYGHKIDKNLLILRSDGGISSQIAFWALGIFYENQGYKLKYDLSWFEEHGKDMDGVFDRNFDLLRAFPSIKIETANEKEIFHYKRHFRSRDKEIKTKTPPVYLGEYYDRWPLVIKYREHIKKHFKPDSLNFDDYNQALLNKIGLHEHACAIHVRRGDLGVYNEIYGEPLGPKYFLEAISHTLDKFPNTFFYFFSDESNWITSNITPKLNDNINYEIVTGNGSDKGYLDLYLMSKCNSFIASHGSLAKYARVLSSDNAFIIEPRSKSTFNDQLLDNVMII
jgi:hypothetical protein